MNEVSYKKCTRCGYFFTEDESSEGMCDLCVKVCTSSLDGSDKKVVSSNEEEGALNSQYWAIYW